MIGERGQKEAVLKWMKYCMRNDFHRLLSVDETCFFASWNLFKEIEMSFTDCTNLSLMKLYGIDKIMTFDMGFRDKGVEVVL